MSSQEQENVHSRYGSLSLWRHNNDDGFLLSSGDEANDDRLTLANHYYEHLELYADEITIQADGPR